MERLTKFFMERRTLFWSLITGLLVIGILSYMRMPKLEDPSVPIKQVSVVAIYPGADEETVELDVAIPIEDVMRTVPDVDKIKTDVQNGQAIVTVEFVKETPKADVEQHFDIVRRRISDLASRLPGGCMTPVVVDDMMDVYGLFYAFHGDGYTLPELESYAKMLRRELVTVPGVKRINIGGTRQEVINIDILPEQLRANGLLPAQVMMALQSATATVNGGAAESGTQRFTLQVTESVRNADDVADIQIKTPGGKLVRLGELAKIERGYAEPASNLFFVNGRPALTVAITLDDTAVVPDVGKAVDARIAEVAGRMPVGMETEKIFFQPDKVDSAMQGFMINLLESIIIVVVVLMLAMGWKAGVIIGFGLVLTVAFSFPLLSAAGTTLQRISLGAFIVAMGMLVDNAVVIMDGILVDRKRGLAPDTYLYRVGRNTAMPLLGATIIAACTFLPIYLTPGSVGEFAGDLFTVICVSLLVSWILALIQVPVCAAAWMHDRPAQAARTAGDVMDGKTYRAMRAMLEWLLNHRTLSITAAIALLVLSSFGMQKVRRVFFPDFDYQQFVVECYFPGENNSSAVLGRVLAMADTVAQFDEVDRVAVSTGGAPGRYAFVRPMPTGGANYAELIIDCRDYKTVCKAADLVRERLRAIQPDAYVRTRKYNFSIGSSHTVEVEFAGPDAEVLRQLAAQAEEVMLDCALVDRYSVQNNWRPMAPSLKFHFSQQAAERAGITRKDVGNALQAATDGNPVGVINDGDKMTLIQLRLRNADGSKVSPLTSIPVWSTININPDTSGDIFATTLLDNVVDSASLVYANDYIYRYNGQRAIQVECDPDPLNPDATPAVVVSQIEDAIRAIPLPPGYTMRFAGEGELSGEATGLILGYLPMILIIIMVILLLLFNSWRKLGLIILCFPFVICGIMPMLYLTDTPFTFMAILGFMGLIGMMVKNAIVLVDETNRLQTEEQMHEYEAIILATMSRTRPVIMASFTTILGMIPLIGDAMYGSLAVTVIGGLAMGTITTLLLLPLFYSVLFKVRKRQA